MIGGGDWSKNRIIPDALEAYNTNKVLFVRNPKSTRPWQHVLEPLSGYLRLACSLNESNELHGESFNFGPPAKQNQSVIDLTGTKSFNEILEKISNNDLRVGWNFHRRLDDYGSDTYFSHITIDWFDNFRVNIGIKIPEIFLSFFLIS